VTPATPIVVLGRNIRLSHRHAITPGLQWRWRELYEHPTHASHRHINDDDDDDINGSCGHGHSSSSACHLFEGRDVCSDQTNPVRRVYDYVYYTIVGVYNQPLTIITPHLTTAVHLPGAVGRPLPPQLSPGLSVHFAPLTTDRPTLL